MVDALIEVGVEHHAAIDVQKPPPGSLLEVPAEHGFGVAIFDAGSSEMNLLVVRSEDPRAGFVDHAKDAVACGQGAPQTSLERPCFVEDRLDRDSPRP